MKNVLEFLEESAAKFPLKTAAKDEKEECTYGELLNVSRKIGTFLAGECSRRKPVAVFMEKSVKTLQIFMGIVYSGNFYVLVDPGFPKQRVDQIFGVLSPEAVITSDTYADKLKDISYDGKVFQYEDMLAEADSDVLAMIRKDSMDTDPLYCIFTSGSTGVPKGVLVCHRSVIDFISVFVKKFGITSEDVIGNQAPFDFDVSVKDIYSALKVGATLVIIPKSYFMFPNSVVDMLDDNKVTTIIWAVSALCLLNRLHGLKYKVPCAINKIMFSGEMMPVKQLEQWRAHYPDAMFVNLYGPTEITCNCTFHIVDRTYEGEERIPMGLAFDNEKVFLLDEDDHQVVEPGINGEVCVSGTTLALGYYNNPEATNRAFVNNPLNESYPETIYRTGDLAFYGEDGLLYFAGRKDFQIKHMGHRIELEEIDRTLNGVSIVERGCTFFDDKKNKIVAFYTGEDDRRKIIDEMRSKVPDFMVPNVFIRVEEMPLTKNGKIDRNHLKDVYQNGGKHEA